MLSILAMQYPAVSGFTGRNLKLFPILSDDDGIAVRVRSRRNSTIRVLQLPATVLQSLKGQSPKAA